MHYNSVIGSLRSVNTIFVLIFVNKGGKGENMNDSLTMTYSAIVTGKDQKKMVRVRFERENNSGGADFAEGIIPDCSIQSQSGFSDDEVFQLEQYLKANMEDIRQKAKVISNPLKWL